MEKPRESTLTLPRGGGLVQLMATNNPQYVTDMDTLAQDLLHRYWIRKPTHDQFYVRACFSQALLNSNEAHTLKQPVSPGKKPDASGSVLSWSVPRRNYCPRCWQPSSFGTEASMWCSPTQRG